MIPVFDPYAEASAPSNPPAINPESLQAKKHSITKKDVIAGILVVSCLVLVVGAIVLDILILIAQMKAENADHRLVAAPSKMSSFILTALLFAWIDDRSTSWSRSHTTVIITQPTHIMVL